MKECFTCINKQSKELTKEERQLKIDEERKKAKAEKRWADRIPEMEYTCNITKKLINQTDPACEHYKDNPDFVEIRKMISDTARKLRKELE